MFWALALLAAGHLAAIVFIMVRGFSNLPAVSLVLASILTTVMAATVIRHLVKPLLRRQLELVYLLNAVVVGLNLLIVRFGTVATIDLAEVAAIGTLFDILVSVTLIILSRRRSRYVRFYRS